jgi:hypothetical protein
MARATEKIAGFPRVDGAATGTFPCRLPFVLSLFVSCLCLGGCGLSLPGFLLGGKGVQKERVSAEDRRLDCLKSVVG